MLPILSANCLVCHGQDEKSRKAGLRLDVPEAATKVLKAGSRDCSRNLKESALIERIFAADEERMPPPGTHKQLKASRKGVAQTVDRRRSGVSAALGVHRSEATAAARDQQ